ncbi:USP6NL [Acrasis kona]|uniref:USP6NL n=1 Tax=Acrasis kona TaxID=1008807 RepID=A0AAW2ZFA4_9EUKA
MDVEEQPVSEPVIYTEISEAAKSGNVMLLLKLLTGSEMTVDECDNILDDAMKPIPVKPEIETLNFTEPDTGNTPLHFAAKFNKIDCISILLRCDGVEVNAPNKEGQTPLHLSVISDAIQITHLLLHKGGDLNYKDLSDETPVTLAVSLKRESCFKLMMEFGADVSLLYTPAMQEEISNSIQYDHRGFVIDAQNEKATHPKLDRALQVQNNKEELRLPKWQKMMRKCKANVLSDKPKLFGGYPHKKIKERVRKGVPDAARADLWMVLSGAEVRKAKNAGIYQELRKQPSRHVKQIDLDINRCYRDHKMFIQRYGPGQIKLFNVLKAYSVHNARLGYCQGMASITALILMYLPEEEDAFWLLASVLEDEKYSLAGCFEDGFPRLFESFYIHERIIESFLPRLYKQMSKAKVETSMYATRWYMQVMLDILPFEASIRVWDLFISEGRKVVYSFALGVLKMNEEQLRSADFENMVHQLNGLERSDIDFTELVRLATKTKIKHKKISAFEAMYMKNKKKLEETNGGTPK